MPLCVLRGCSPRPQRFRVLEDQNLKTQSALRNAAEIAENGYFFTATATPSRMGSMVVKKSGELDKS